MLFVVVIICSFINLISFSLSQVKIRSIYFLTNFYKHTNSKNLSFKKVFNIIFCVCFFILLYIVYLYCNVILNFNKNL